MRIYISIPISGHDLAAQQRPFSVPAPPSHLTEKERYAYYMGEDMKMLLTCDAILMVDKKWSRSKGCSIEHNAAYMMGLEIFYTIDDVPNGNRSKENN